MEVHLAFIQTGINSSDCHLRLGSTISSRKVKSDLVVLQNMLFHNIIEKGVEAICCHFRESEANYTIEIGLENNFKF